MSGRRRRTGSKASRTTSPIQLWPDALDRLETYIEKAIERVPLLGTVGVQRVINGPIPYSPDGNPYIGRRTACRTSTRPAASPSASRNPAAPARPRRNGSRMASRNGTFWSLDPAPLHRLSRPRATWWRRRSSSTRTNTPSRSRPTNGRPAVPAKTTALYDKLKAKGAFFLRARRLGACRPGSRGWATMRRASPSFRRTNWHEAVAEECKAVRERVGILDLGGFTKLGDRGQGRQRLVGRP
jgi:dimethylglycine dehydrogenase